MRGNNGHSKKKFIDEQRLELNKSLKEFLADEDKANSYMVRFHRCYIGGDYGGYNEEIMTGEKVYNLYRGRAKKNNGAKAWRDMAITTLRAFIGIEFYQREHMPSTQEVEDVLTITLKDKKEEYVGYLVQNLKDLAED